jgi:hypothetical protein
MFNYLKPKYMDVGGIFGGSDAGSSGAQQVGIYNQQAIDELKRQYEETKTNLAPFLTAGTDALTGVTQGASFSGLGERLNEIFNSSYFDGLVGERTNAVNSNLAASGLMRSGTAIEEAANIPTDLALQIESLISGRETGLANTGLNAAVGIGNTGSATASAIANLLNNTGQAYQQGAITDAQSDAAGTQNLINTGLAVAGIFSGGGFSDPALKENIEEVGQIHDLKLYQWDWIEKAKDTIVDKCMTMGFMADEVKEKYPQFIHEFAGFMTVDYHGLLNHLEAK